MVTLRDRLEKKGLLPKYHFSNYKGIGPLHEIRDWSKVKRLVRAVERGERVTPYILDDRLTMAHTGTHRLTANELLARRGKTKRRIRGIAFSDLKRKYQNSLENVWDGAENDWDFEDLLDSAYQRKKRLTKRIKYALIMKRGLLPDNYFSRYRGIKPLHEVRDWGKVKDIVRAVERGEPMPPIIMGISGKRAATGTHRLAANELLARRKRTRRRIKRISEDRLRGKVGRAWAKAIQGEIDQNKFDRIFDRQFYRGKRLTYKDKDKFNGHIAALMDVQDEW